MVYGITRTSCPLKERKTNYVYGELLESSLIMRKTIANRKKYILFLLGRHFRAYELWDYVILLFLNLQVNPILFSCEPKVRGDILIFVLLGFLLPGRAMGVLSSGRGSIAALVFFLVKFSTATEIPLSGKVTAFNTYLMECHICILIFKWNTWRLSMCFSAMFLHVFQQSVIRISLCLFHLMGGSRWAAWALPSSGLWRLIESRP